MKKLLGAVLGLSLLSMGGCSFIDVNALSTQTAYVYQKDINSSDRYNAGSDYFVQWALEANYKVLYLDYGVSSYPFKATYTLPTEQKISIDVDAEIIFRLKRNPNDKNGELHYNQDPYVQFFANSVSPVSTNGGSVGLIIRPELVWGKLMAEPTDLAFRSVFTNAEKYESFDTLESSIVAVQNEIKETLSTKANDYYIEVVGVKIKDIPVPDSIAKSRSKNLELTQESINQIQELQIKARNAAAQMAVDVRYAMNDVIIDNLVASQVDKGYMFMETLRKGVENGNAMTINVTPDFMRYLEHGDTTDPRTAAEMKHSQELFEKLDNMSSDELVNYFNKSKDSVKLD